ncbi:dynein regulatory complex protein 1 [Trichomycterus rosablanca]|uniref:dynein regulatory complex protein 1 n=1 Tax=Trichomycterus rosablanca TaxID=2290929 RepID=UPI002F35370E
MLQAENFAEEKDETGPSVESENAEERIAARRLRIAARIQARKRRELGDDFQEKEKTEEEARPSQKQVEQSEKHMNKLQEDGTEMVTNILVASDARESKRRAELEEARRLRIDKLETEAKSSLEKCEEIMHKWTVAKAKNIPQDLRDALSGQQQLCGKIIDNKNKLINELQQELKASDDRYVKDLKRQAGDVDLMIERMQEQITGLMKSYREELDLIENSFSDERKALFTANRKKWEQQRKNRSDKELEYLLQRMKRVEESEVLLQRLREEDTEEYNKNKIKLETDVESLEQQLQNRKATYQLNQEKLEYNFQVLKKREEENMITKSQQKRRITRLQDIVNNLKIKCANQEKQSNDENLSQTNDFKQAMQQYKDTQKKIRHFAAVDAKRFEEVWLMNEAEAKDLVHKALETDRLIHEQVLGLEWTSHPLAFMDRSGPLQLQGQVGCTAHQVAAQVLGSEEEKEGTLKEETWAPDSYGGLENRTGVDQKTVKRLLELLCDNTGFLIESKLLKLLSPLEKNEQSLMKLDSIFSVLGIETEEDVYTMAEYFMKYKQQHMDQTQDDSEVGNQAKDSDLIHPNNVLAALRAFTAQHCKVRGASRHQSSLYELDQREDSEYWESMASVIPESKLKVWSALQTALKKYHTVLTERSKLLSDTQSLKQQNSELSMLLNQYLNSKVNAELAIPPTRFMQLGPE